MQLKEYEQSIAILNELEAEDKFAQYLDLILYETGIAYLENNKLDEAIQNFSIIDTMKTPSQKETPGLSRLKLGELWEYQFMDFDSAAKYYNKASSSILLTEEKSYAISKTTLFRNYKRLATNIYKNERQLDYLFDREEFIKDSIDYEDYIFELKQDSARNASANIEGTQISARAESRALGLQALGIQTETMRTKPVYPKISADSLMTIVSKDKYDLGNMFFIEMNIPDSAFYYYKDVLDNYPKRPFTPNVVYALGSYYLSVNDTVSADSIFRFIYDEYQGLPVADQAARRLGILEFDVESDSSAQFYIDAEKKLNDEKYSEAIKDFYLLAEKFPESVIAPKALYSAGWVWENKLGSLDSAAAAYDTLVARYDKSLYAKDVF
ncbi:MAG: tetratricopeptide repeat protein, partial [Melioribacteraceae bacterium]